MRRYALSLRFDALHVGEDRPPDPIDKPQVVVDYMQGAFESRPEQEAFWVVHLNVKSVPRARELISIGTQSRALVHPREVFRAAILAGSSAVVCVHNHPSGDPAPSSSDIDMTRQLRRAGEVVGIPVLDHVIIGDATVDPNGTGFYSFREAGIL